MFHRVSNYQIIKSLGQGGMAKVFLAKHIRLGNYVAIKVLNKDMAANPNIRKRFSNEAKIMAELQHINIVKVIDFISNDNFEAIVMEYVEGISLNKYISDSRFGFQHRISVFLQILDAFNYAHQKGVVHRDIKPDNIIIRKDNLVKILDFGIAKAVYSNTELTNHGSQLGTPLFMSPEQVKDSKNIDNLSDIYSLGVLFYYISQRKFPYDSSVDTKFEIFNKIVNEKLPDLRYHKEFNFIVQKATKKNPAERYLTCQQFADDIIRVIKNPNQKPVSDTNVKTDTIIDDSKLKISFLDNDIVGQEKTEKQKSNVNQVKTSNPTSKKRKRKKNKNKALTNVLATFIVLVLASGGYFGWAYWNDKQPKRIVIDKAGDNIGRIILPYKSLNGKKTYVVFANNKIKKEKYISAVVVDEDGKLLDEHRIDQTKSCEIKNVYKLEDGSGYILGGYKINKNNKSVGNAWISKIDNDFNNKWQEMIFDDEKNWSCVYGIEHANNSSAIIIVGSKQTYNTNLSKSINHFFVEKYSILDHKYEDYFMYFLLDIDTDYKYKMGESVAFDVVQKHDQNGYVVTGYMYTDNYVDSGSYSKDAFILSINNKLDYKNFKIIGGAQNDKFFKIIKGHDNDYLLAGFSNSFHEKSGSGWVLNIDDNLKTNWSKIYPRSGYKNEYLSIKKLKNKSYLLSGYAIINQIDQMRFTKINIEGDKIFDNLIENNYYGENARNFIITDKNMFNDRFIISTGYHKNPDKDILIYKQIIN